MQQEKLLNNNSYLTPELIRLFLACKIVSQFTDEQGPILYKWRNDRNNISSEEKKVIGKYLNAFYVAYSGDVDGASSDDLAEVIDKVIEENC